jgi:hypothetical protein
MLWRVFTVRSVGNCDCHEERPKAVGTLGVGEIICGNMESAYPGSWSLF